MAPWPSKVEGKRGFPSLATQRSDAVHLRGLAWTCRLGRCPVRQLALPREDAMARPKHRPVLRPYGFTSPRRSLLAAGATLLAAGAGALTVSPLAGSVAGASTMSVQRVILTNQSNGSTTIVTKGERVVVKLHSAGFTWTEASVINASPEVVLKKVSGHVSSGGSSVTKFLVVGYGSVSLQATGTAQCSSA